MIRLENVNKTYHDNNNNTFTIKDLTLNIDHFDTFGIVGKSGAGKSTILNLISKLEDVDSGKILVDNIIINDLKGKDLYNHSKSIGFIFQNDNLLKNLNVIDNISLPLKLNGVKKNVRHQKALELLTYIGLENLEKRYPHQLSGGQKQRVAIARALINNPKLLLCDEITTSLDYDATFEILSLLDKIKHDLKLTIVFVSHDLRTVKLICNKVAIINNGKLESVVSIKSNNNLSVINSLTYLEYLEGDKL